MISERQKQRLFSSALFRQLRSGRPARIAEVIAQVGQQLKGLRFGAPLTRPRPAIPNAPIGGPRGTDLTDTAQELRVDLELLYEAQLELTRRSLDLYDLFTSRRDRLTTALNQLQRRLSTLLSQQGAGNRAAFTETFHTLEHVDLARTTASVDLESGSCGLNANSLRSVRYDGARVQLVSRQLPVGASESGLRFTALFSDYRTEAWYATLPEAGEFVAIVNVTGADYERGATEEIELNALRLEPTGPVGLQLDWSPDGHNWHALDPGIHTELTVTRTFHFEPVRVGYLRFRLRALEPGPIGFKRIQLLRRGYDASASFYSKELRFNELIYQVVPEVTFEQPFGTRVRTYLAENAAGPWTLLDGSAVSFENRHEINITLDGWEAEQPGQAHTLWLAPLTGSRPLPGTGELVAGNEQVELSAFPFDWALQGEAAHPARREDWVRPNGEPRSGTFEPVPGGLGSSTVTASGQLALENPLTLDLRDGSYLIATLVQGNGEWVLQPGYNYRLRVYLHAEAAAVLANQRIAVVNPGGTAGLEIAPLSVTLNGQRVYEQLGCAASTTSLASSRYQTSLSLRAGWNELDLYLQIPTGQTPGQGGLAANNIHLYFQPNVFDAARRTRFGISGVRAYREPWRRVSEFDLRHNIPLGFRSAWAWKHDFSTNRYTGVLLNHDPMNAARHATAHVGYQTIDGVCSAARTELHLQYPMERGDGTGRTLFVRTELTMDPDAVTPPTLHGYRLLIN